MHLQLQNQAHLHHVHPQEKKFNIPLLAVSRKDAKTGQTAAQIADVLSKRVGLDNQQVAEGGEAVAAAGTSNGRDGAGGGGTSGGVLAAPQD